MGDKLGMYFDDRQVEIRGKIMVNGCYLCKKIAKSCNYIEDF